MRVPFWSVMCGGTRVVEDPFCKDLHTRSGHGNFNGLRSLQYSICALIKRANSYNR